jgi:hypothetical protein
MVTTRPKAACRASISISRDVPRRFGERPQVQQDGVGHLNQVRHGAGPRGVDAEDLGHTGGCTPTSRSRIRRSRPYLVPRQLLHVAAAHSYLIAAEVAADRSHPHSRECPKTGQYVDGAILRIRHLRAGCSPVPTPANGTVHRKARKAPAFRNMYVRLP